MGTGWEPGEGEEVAERQWCKQRWTFCEEEQRNRLEGAVTAARFRRANLDLSAGSAREVVWDRACRANIVDWSFNQI